MRLRTDWRVIVRKAWSVRFMALAALLTGFEVVVPIVFAELPRLPFAALSFAAVAAALVARLVAQKGL